MWKKLILLGDSNTQFGHGKGKDLFVLNLRELNYNNKSQILKANGSVC